MELYFDKRSGECDIITTLKMNGKLKSKRLPILKRADFGTLFAQISNENNFMSNLSEKEK